MAIPGVEDCPWINKATQQSRREDSSLDSGQRQNYLSPHCPKTFMKQWMDKKGENLRCWGASRKQTTNMKIFSRHMQTVTVFLPYMVVDEKRKQVFLRSYTSPKDGGVVSLWGGFVEANSSGREMDARRLSRMDESSCSRRPRAPTSVLDQ